MDIKQRLIQARDFNGEMQLDRLALGELCRDALAEIERLEAARDEEVRRHAQTHDYWSQQDVGTGVHRIADSLGKLSDLVLEAWKHR